MGNKHSRLPPPPLPSTPVPVRPPRISRPPRPSRPPPPGLIEAAAPPVYQRENRRQTPAPPAYSVLPARLVLEMPSFSTETALSTPPLSLLDCSPEELVEELHRAEGERQRAAIRIAELSGELHRRF